MSAEAEADFEGPSLGTILEQGLESYEDEDVPQQRFDDVLAVLGECPTFGDTDDTGAKTDFPVSSLSFPKMGDDTIALNIKVATADFNGSVNFVVVRLGRNVMSIAQGGLTADVPTLEQAVTKGLEKLAAATESPHQGTAAPAQMPLSRGTQRGWVPQTAGPGCCRYRGQGW